MYVRYVCQGIQAFIQLNPLQLLWGYWQGRAGYRVEVSEEGREPLVVGSQEDAASVLTQPRFRACFSLLAKHALNRFLEISWLEYLEVAI